MKSRSQPKVITTLQELAIAANELQPVAATLQTVMNIIGRYTGWLLGRVVTRADSEIEGHSVFVWHNPERPHPESPGFDWDRELVESILADGRPRIVAEISAESGRTFEGIKPEFHGYAAYPIRVENSYVAVIEFYSGEPLDGRSDLLEVLAHGATLLGPVIGRGRTQARLRDSERRFRAIFDQSYQFIGLLEPDGTLIEANETALEFGGLGHDEVVGRKYWDTYWWSASPDSRATLRSAVTQAAAGKFVRHEAEIRGRDDSVVIIDFSIKPIRNRKGDVILLIAEGRDITELRRALQHVRLTEFRLEEAQRIAHMGHWDYNLAGEEAAWSSMLFEIFGLDPATNIENSQAFLDMVHPEDVPALREAFERSFRTGRPYEHHFRITRPDGLVRTLFGAGGPVVDDSGQITRMAGIIQDVTGRHQLEESLAHMVERLSGLNTMGQTVASSLDLPSIYGHVLSTGRQLLKSAAIVLFLHEGRELLITAVDQDANLNLLGQRLPDNAGVAGESWTMGRPVWVTGDECRRRRSAQLAHACNFEPGSLIAVPVRWQDEILGVLQAADADDDAFTLDDVRTLQAVANWTAIAIGKARQHSALERRVQESEAIAAVGRALGETLEPRGIVELIVQAAHDVVPRSDWAVMHLLRGRPERLDPVAVAGTDDDFSDYVIERDEGIAGLVFTQGEPINVRDTRTDMRASAYARAIGLRSLLVAPILARNRRLGTISLHCKEPGAFTEVDERLLTILAAQAGLAIENTHLFDSQRRARAVAELQRERLRVLTDRLVSTQEDERLRISRELHDEAGQALTSLKISLDLLRNGLPPEQDQLRARLTDLATLTGETMDTLRTLAHDLRPPGLDAFGLNVALEGLCQDFASRTGLTAAYEGLELPELPTAVALSLYRFAQEALTNIAKHAEAREVNVRLSRANGSLMLAITDDGRGFAFDPDSRQDGVGLVSMQERADLLNGSLEINTAPGQGTRLTICVPLDNFEPAAEVL